MKHFLRVSLFVFALFSIISCQKIKDAVASNIGPVQWQDDDIVLTIPASNNLSSQTTFGTQHFDINQYLKDNSSGQADFGLVKVVKITSFTATALNADANNNFNNFDYTSGVAPILIFNTTPSPTNATIIGQGLAPTADPATQNVSVTGADIKSHLNGTDWDFGYTYKLAKPLTHDLQVKLHVNYEFDFH